MFVVCDGLHQTQDVFPRVFVEAIEQDSVGRPVVRRQLQFGIVHGDVAIVSNAQFGPDLKNNLHPFTVACHRFASWFAFSIIASNFKLPTYCCNSTDAAPGRKDLPPTFSVGNDACR